MTSIRGDERLDTLPDVERQMLFRSGNCNFTSVAEDFIYESIIYEPGIIIPGEHADQGDGNLTIIPKACEKLISDRNVGDFVFIDLIQREILENDWYTTSSHWYLLSSIENEGQSKWEVRLSHPKTALDKGETLYWSDEFTRLKYQNDAWFERISNVSDAVRQIVID